MSDSEVALDLRKKHCAACEGETRALSSERVRDLLTALPEWNLAGGGLSIRRDWRVQDFATALDFVRRVGEVAETENHHPDVHVTGYRNVTIELSTHAVKGLTENDFILAAKIDSLPVPLAAGSSEPGQAQAHWKAADSAPDSETAAMQRATRAAEPQGRT